MKTLRAHLRRSLENKTFANYFNEEKKLLQVSMQMLNARKKLGRSQHEIARAAHLTQQQVSKVEQGANCNILTYLKVGQAMGLTLSIHPAKYRAANA